MAIATATTAPAQTTTILPRSGQLITFPVDRRRAQMQGICSEVAHPAEQCVRCVGGCCDELVPQAVMEAAWQAEQLRGRGGDGFFHFAHRGEAWLSYGLEDGSVRGVYCPQHRAQREQRLGYDPSLAA